MTRTARWLARRIAGPGTGRPAPLSALRMALALALPLGLGLAYGRLDLGSVGAIAALFTAIVEPGGGYRRHTAVYASVTAMNLVVVIMAVLVAASPIAAGVVMLILGTIAGLASAWGSVPTLAAPAPLGLFILTQGLHPTPRMADAIVAVLVGSGWVILISVAPWPIAPFAPAELAVGDAWLSVAALARDVGNDRREAAANAAIENARDVVSSIRRRRAGWSDRSHRLWSTLLAAQRVTALLGAVADDRRREPADARTRAAMDQMLAAVADFSAELASNAVRPNATPDADALNTAAAAVKAAVPATDTLTGAPLHTALVAAARARAAARLRLRLADGAEALDLPAAPHVHVPRAHPDHWQSRVRATLSWHSTALLHGLRLGAACGISMGIFTAIGPQGFLGITHGSWVTITLMVVLRPTLGDSLEHVAQRAIGTALGGIVAVAMLAALPLEWALSVGLVIVGALAALLKPVNALWYVVLFTPIPLVFAASTGRAGTDILWERLIATGVACSAGLIVATIIWPTRGGEQLPSAMADALRTDALSLDAVVSIVVGDARPGSASEAQRHAMLAADEATRVAQAQLVESLTAFTHPRPVIALEAAVLRLPREITALGLRARKHGVEIPGIEAVRARAVRALNDIATELEGRHAPEPVDDLIATLDPAWELLSRREAQGVPDAPLAAAVDALDSILHAIERVADDATIWAQVAPDRRGGLWARLTPAPRKAAATG